MQACRKLTSFTERAGNQSLSKQDLHSDCKRSVGGSHHRHSALGPRRKPRQSVLSVRRPRYSLNSQNARTDKRYLNR